MLCVIILLRLLRYARNDGNTQTGEEKRPDKKYNVNVKLLIFNAQFSILLMIITKN
jgi:hypothetical protein